MDCGRKAAGLHSLWPSPLSPCLKAEWQRRSFQPKQSWGTLNDPILASSFAPAGRQASPLRVPQGAGSAELLLSFQSLFLLPAPWHSLVRQDIPVKIFCAYFKSLINDKY